MPKREIRGRIGYTCSDQVNYVGLGFSLRRRLSSNRVNFMVWVRLGFWSRFYARPRASASEEVKAPLMQTVMLTGSARVSDDGS